MAEVKHMKWWGWGVEGVSFHHENKPAFRPFVINAIDLDVNTPATAPMSLDDLAIPTPMISDQLLTELADAVGAENAVQDDLDRIAHVRQERTGPVADTRRRHPARAGRCGLSRRRG